MHIVKTLYPEFWHQQYTLDFRGCVIFVMSACPEFLFSCSLFFSFHPQEGIEGVGEAGEGMTRIMIGAGDGSLVGEMNEGTTGPVEEGTEVVGMATGMGDEATEAPAPEGTAGEATHRSSENPHQVSLVRTPT